MGKGIGQKKGAFYSPKTTTKVEKNDHHLKKGYKFEILVKKICVIEGKKDIFFLKYLIAV